MWSWARSPSSVAARLSTPGNLVRKSCYSTGEQPFYRRMFWNRKKAAVDAAREKAKEEQDSRLKAEEMALMEEKAEADEVRFRMLRNKSKLRASDRQVLRGQPPRIGLHPALWSPEHATRAHQARLLGRFGRAATGLDPSVAWPSSAEIRDVAAFEAVLYDGQTDLADRVKAQRLSAQQETDAIRQREDEIDRKWSRQDEELKAWTAKLDQKRLLALKEQQKKDLIMAELRQEFGYDVNPHDPQFAEKIAEKEKHHAKLAKEAKKKEKAEKDRARKEAFEQVTTSG